MIHSEVNLVDVTTFRCDRLLTPATRHEPGLLRVRNGTVVAAEDARPDIDGSIVLRGTVVPGLVDLQVNGLGPHDVLDATPEAIVGIGVALLAHGVTAWLPTIISSGEDRRLKALEAIAQARARAGGARVLGAHLEGPWLAPERAGAHDPNALERPTADAIARSLAHPGLVRVVTLAPEIDGGLEAIRTLSEAGVVASIGHTDATLDEALAGVDAGARMVTHLFNAMRPIHHRDPGVVAAALTDDRVTCGLIGDAAHVHPVLVGFTLRACAGRIALVSDVVAGRGERVVRLKDGTLAGSLMPLDEGVRVATRAGIDIADAVAAASSVAATLLGEPCGRLEPGAPADFVVLDDDLVPAATYMGGELVWARSHG